MFLSRAGFELGETWHRFQRLQEDDRELQQVRRNVRKDPTDREANERLEAAYARHGMGSTPEALNHSYQWRSRERDEWERRFRAGEGSGEPSGKGRYFTRDEYKAKDAAHHAVWDVIKRAREHHGNEAGLHLAPYKGHDVERHLKDLLHASGGQSYDVRRVKWQPDAHPEGKSLTGEMAATTWADTPKETGEAFDAAFKKHYPHEHSSIRQDSVMQDERNTDHNGRRFSIHPHDVDGRNR